MRISDWSSDVCSSDLRVWNLTPHFTSYTVSKAGLWTLTRTMALALAPRIRVTAIGPGPTLKSTHQTEAQFRRQRLEERRVGKEGVSTCRHRRAPDHSQKDTQNRIRPTSQPTRT